MTKIIGISVLGVIIQSSFKNIPTSGKNSYLYILFVFSEGQCRVMYIQTRRLYSQYFCFKGQIAGNSSF